MKDLLLAGRAILLDIASTIFFLGLYAITRNVMLAAAIATVLAASQIGWSIFRRRRVDALQWVSLVIVVGSGAATVITHNPVFVMLKPTAIYILVGCAMLQKGWMTRYMPERAIEQVPDLVTQFGYVWAGLMFFSALLNLVLASSADVILWGSIMSIWATGSKVALFFLQYGWMRFIGRRRYRMRLVAE